MTPAKAPPAKGSRAVRMVIFTVLALIILGFGVGMFVSPESFSPEALDRADPGGRRGSTFLEIVRWMVGLLGTTGTGVVLCLVSLVIVGVTYRRQILVSGEGR